MKTKVLFASSLKPACDTRTEKLLQSFNGYDCFFCGVRNSQILSQSTTWKYSRSLIFRIQLVIKFFVLVNKIKPQVIVINSLEFVPVLKLLKYKLGFKLIYDMQEDYVKNITYHNGFKGLKRIIGIAYVQSLTNQLFKFVDGVIYAETVYQQEVAVPSLVLENKSILKVRRNKESSNPIRLLFTGTLTKECGVYQALEWLSKLEKIGAYELIMIGHTPLVEDHKRLREIRKENFTYKGSLSPIAHQDLVDEMVSSDFGLICYESSPSKKGKMPTKLFEYMSICLPVICQNDGFWSELVIKEKAGVVYRESLTKLDFEDTFYEQDVKGVHWETEKLTNWLSEVL